jgi:Protein of unknown function (DUF2911)
MKKYIWIIFGVALVAVIGYVVYVREQGEFKSPQQKVAFNDGDLKIDVVYGSPSKRGREIFGGLVPYDKVWRTGANEATEFHTNKDLDFGGQELKAGDYSLWSQPGKETWKIYFNSHIPNWGIDKNGIVARVPENDVVTMEVSSASLDQEKEMFTMTIEKADSIYNLVLAWDKTKVAVPFSAK